MKICHFQSTSGDEAEEATMIIAIDWPTERPWTVLAVRDHAFIMMQHGGDLPKNDFGVCQLEMFNEGVVQKPKQSNHPIHQQGGIMSPRPELNSTLLGLHWDECTPRPAVRGKRNEIHRSSGPTGLLMLGLIAVIAVEADLVHEHVEESEARSYGSSGNLVRAGRQMMTAVPELLTITSSR
ncbi:uncharacterized protein BCR38DRAFT_55914 [Pseudomassariella vexata]|uniref:Uncharacterized protein n=1 Tax=Pseudomassariella vexata TaxID=1141098 RepID=A0A1Y2DM36_9PEZI|nr:uncharacterized protein BCR38DRAFT_55914 [Pseudomassariella vexata]ORY60196.1 hypothetical protein BCR38DRAFT_55914 [Pseudomassariella vexata]